MDPHLAVEGKFYKGFFCAILTQVCSFNIGCAIRFFVSKAPLRRKTEAVTQSVTFGN